METPFSGRRTQNRRNAMKLSILIVNWNSKDYVRKCLESLRNDTLNAAPQIVVVDGGSFDGCAGMIAAEFPEVEFVQSPDNIGFGRCNNLGFNLVKGEFVLLLNPDTEVFPGAIERLMETLERHPDAGIVGARLLNPDGSLQEASIHPLPTPLNTALDTDRRRKRWWARHGLAGDGGPMVVEAVSGACMLMRSKLFRQLGGFNPVYFMYAEDMDLCLKVHRTGLRVYHVPTALVTHHGGGSSRTRFSKFATVMIREAVDVYMRENHGVATSLRYRFLMAISAVARIALLAPGWAVGSRESRLARKTSITKWWAVLRWAFGKESWAREHFLPPASLGGSTSSILSGQTATAD
jgi:GT2 family glycosyltransferase